MITDYFIFLLIHIIILIQQNILYIVQKLFLTQKNKQVCILDKLFYLFIFSFYSTILKVLAMVAVLVVVVVLAVVVGEEATVVAFAVYPAVAALELDYFFSSPALFTQT